MQSKREFWFRHIEAWRKGKLAQSEYARKHNLSIKSFGYYRRRYFREQEQAEPKAVPSTLVPVAILPESPEPTVQQSQEPGINLISPSGYRIELLAGFDTRTLQKVLTVLEAV